MRILLVLLIALLGSSDLICAETYRCRDNEGQLHVTDNLQLLPEECRDRVETLDKESPDNLNFVPQVDVSLDVKQEFERDVREADREVEHKKARGAALLRQAEAAADLFEQAKKEKRQAKRRWTSKSRETIKKADKQIAQARETKERLVRELDDNRVARDTKETILSALKRISD